MFIDICLIIFLLFLGGNIVPEGVQMLFIIKEIQGKQKNKYNKGN
ncbi:hypothetical protein OENI_670004 [Oenococcus oeni]|nr:hypothetical protein OENI_670004 [Oenococcus oeni]